MTARGDRTRNHLLDVAEQLFGARGVNGVSLREIRIESGARNTAAIQFHFGDRDGLIQALFTRHMPRLAAKQQTLYDAMIAEGRESDPRRLVEVLVRPSADYLREGPSERAWVKIISDLGAAPDLEASQMALLAPEPALRVSYKLYELLADLVEPAVATERMVVLAQSTVHICGDRARLEDAGDRSRKHVSNEVFVENLIDMVAGALFAPAHTSVAATETAPQR
jgi:AcrR family transcriptional regulator